MGKIQRLTVLVAWLLLVIIVVPFAAKNVHIYQSSDCSHHNCSDESHSRHDCNDCPVCGFVFSSFTEAETVYYDFRVVTFDFIRAVTFPDKAYEQVLFYYGLRAPPAV
jgi:hypothetical protein